LKEKVQDINSPMTKQVLPDESAPHTEIFFNGINVFITHQPYLFLCKAEKWYQKLPAH